MEAGNFGTSGFTWHFAYHRPDLFYRSSTVDFRYISAPRLALCSFNGTSGFSPDDFLVLNICGGWGGFNSFECFSSGFSSFFALIVKPDNIVFNNFRFAFWNTTWLAIFIRMFVKFPTESSGSRTDSYFKSDAVLSEKAFHLTSESF